MRSSQSEAINTAEASLFSIALSVSFIPTTKSEFFNSSSVIRSHLLFSTLNPRNIGIISLTASNVNNFYPIFLSVYGQLFYHVPVCIIAPNLYTFL